MLSPTKPWLRSGVACYVVATRPRLRRSSVALRSATNLLFFTDSISSQVETSKRETYPLAFCESYITLRMLEFLKPQYFML